MPSQHTIEGKTSQEQGIMVPLELAGLRILKQEVQADGRIRVEVMGNPVSFTNSRSRWVASLPELTTPPPE